MEFALAHDENGSPLDVPATAIGWLVRRHAGGRGRPASVYDGDGRPLVVSLDATTSDLRAEGCRAGMYRLDAVDSSRRPLGVTAYTEVLFDPDSESLVDAVSAGGPPSDAAVAALARAVEAMQRVQAERERAQAERERVHAEMLARLVERLAPAPAPPQRNLADALGEYAKAAKMIRNLAPEPEAEEAAADEGVLAPIVAQLAPLLTPWLMGQAGAMAAKPSAVQPRNAAAVEASEDADEDSEEEASEEVDASAERESRVERIAERLDAVLAVMTKAEGRRVLALSETVPGPLLEQAMQHVLAMPPEKAAVAIRQYLKTQPPAAEKAA